MDLFKYFKAKKAPSTALIAKERLQIIVAHQRLDRKPETSDKAPAYLAKLQQEIMDVIRKYVEVSSDQIKVDLSQSDDKSILELNVTLPDQK
jgi:cell division topological specificity factor